MPSLPPVTAAPTTTSTDPISPVSRTNTRTFPHKTSPAVMSHTSHIDTAQPAINAAPVELDGGSALSPEELRRRTTGDSLAASIRSVEDGDADADADGGFASSRRTKRAQMLEERSNDPGVIVDVPREPTAEEVEAVRRADAIVAAGGR